MQNQKPLSTRVLSLALTAAMVATMMPQAVFAEGTAPIDASGVTTTRTITATGELGEGFSKSVPFDGHTYVLDVKANTPFENVKLPTELSVTVEKITTTVTPSSNDEVANLGESTSTAPVEKPVEPVADEATSTEPSTTTDTDTTVLGNEPATPSGAEPAPVANQGNATIIETTQENVPVTWKGDKEYTAEPNSNVVYTAVLPEGYALKDGTVLPIINVMVSKKVMTPMSAKPRAGAKAVVKRTTTLDLTSASLSYVATGGTTKTADPTKTDIKDTAEGWSWDLLSKTLTLSGATIDCTGNESTQVRCAIGLPDNAIIVLTEGTNNIVISGGKCNGAYGIGVVNGTLTINGNGSLNASGGNDSYNSFGIYAKTALNINGGTITAAADAGTGGGDYVGIRVEGDLTITGGTITASGKTAAIKCSGWEKKIIAAGATVTGATEKFETGVTPKLTQEIQTTPVKIRFAKSVSFDARNGKTVADVEISEGMTLPIPEWTGYTFDGWYSGIDGKDAATSPAFTGKLTLEKAKTLTANTKVYTKWIAANSKTVRTEALDLTGVVTTATNQGWTWDSGAKKLTLDGATIDCSGLPATAGPVFGIQLNTDCHIVLVDGTTNTVKAGTATGSPARSYGVYFKSGIGTPSISGKGTLDATGGGVGSYGLSCGIGCLNTSDTITIREATINASATGSATRVGIDASLNIESGTITAIGIVEAQNDGFGISGNTLMMTGGTLSVFGKTAISMQGGITAASATVTGATIKFVSGTTKRLMQLSEAIPVKFSFIPKISFDARNGVVEKAQIDVDTGKIADLPAAPKWTDYTFAGWYTEVDGKGKVFENKNLTANTTVYANWTKGGKNVRTEALDLTGAVTPATNQGWTWDDTSKKLTLSGATIDCTGLPASEASIFGIKLPDGAIIELATGSTSTVKSGEIINNVAFNGRKTIAIETVGNLTINGTGTLYATGGIAKSGRSCGSYGIRSTAASSSTININGGTIYATGGDITADTAGSVGIHTGYTLAIADGAVINAEGKALTGRNFQTSGGVHASKLTMTGGTLNGIACDVGSGASYSNGVYAETSMILSGTAVVTGIGKTSAIECEDDEEPSTTTDSITAASATVTGATERFTSGVTQKLTQSGADPVKISFGPSIAVAKKNGTASYGTPANLTFAIASNNFGGKYPVFEPSIVWESGTAPTGVTSAISPDNATLTFTTTAATPAGDYKFKVVSPKAAPETGNYESAMATLKVGKCAVTIAWGTNTSFAYDGTTHKPTATVSNAVNGDVLTVTVTGEQTNVGDNYTATASDLAGTAAGNYKLPTTAPTTTFAITAKTVTAIDGNLEVKKPHDGKTTAGTATGSLGLDGVVTADDGKVSVKVDSVGDYADATVEKGKTVTLTISLDGSAKGNYTLSNSSYSFTKAEITKKAYAGTPATAPNGTPTTKGDKSITIAPVTPPTGENVEYAISTTNTAPTSDKDWQISTTFDNLEPNTQYYFFARVKENDTHAPGGVSSPGTLITTDKSVYTGAQATAPEKVPENKTDTSIILKTVTPPTGETVQYGIDKNNDGTITWQNGTTFDGLTAGTVYKFYTRVAETNTHKAGKTSAETTIKTKNINTTVDGKVTNSDSSALEGATVTLSPSNPVITTTTNASGNYNFANVPEGVYSLVITKGTGDSKITITDTITVAGIAITNKNMQFLDGSKNTVVQSAHGTPEVAVSGMNDLLTGENFKKTLTAEEKTAVDGNGSVELKFTANVKPLSEGTADKNVIEAGVAGSQKIDLLLDLSVTKTVKDNKDTIIADGVPIHELAEIITVHLPIPEELQGKAGLSLYRMHNDKAEKLIEGNFTGTNECYTIDDSGTFMTLYLMKFSTYAMGYDAFTAKIIDGGTGASGNGNYSNGDTVTINAGSKSGYTFSGWTVTTGGVTLANANSATTTFVMPTGAVAVTANWTRTGGGTPETYYYINATTSKGGSINTPERVKVIAGGYAGFVITPDKGYQLVDVLINGKSIGAEHYYAFTNVNADQTIHATFKKAGHRNPQTGVDANVD